VHVVAARLRVVVLDQQAGPLHTVVVAHPALRAACPREPQVLRARRVHPAQLRLGCLAGQSPGEQRHQVRQRGQLRRGQVGAADAARPGAYVRQGRALGVGNPVVGFRLEHVVRQLDLADPRHQAGGEVRRRPVPDDRPRALGIRQ
jgi:hypothetical protein